MTRLASAALLAALLAVPAAAQNCNRALERAESSYQNGEFDATIDRLTVCLDTGSFSTEERRQAYRLIGLSYIGKDREADARAAVASLLEVAPAYEPDPAVDPPPFVRMVTELQRRPASGTATAGDTASHRANSASTHRGFSASFDLHAMGYSDDDDDSFAGGGGRLVLGYGITPAFVVYGQLGGASGDSPDVDGYSVALGEFGVGARYYIGGGRASLVPYVGASLAAQSAEYRADGLGSVTYDGGGLGAEAGLRYFLSPSFALGGGLSVFGTSLAPDGADQSISATTVYLGAGLTWQP
jgi:hypothetical protein